STGLAPRSVSISALQKERPCAARRDTSPASTSLPRATPCRSLHNKIGKASCRGKEEKSGGAGSLKKKKKKKRGREVGKKKEGRKKRKRVREQTRTKRKGNRRRTAAAESNNRQERQRGKTHLHAEDSR